MSFVTSHEYVPSDRGSASLAMPAVSVSAVERSPQAEASKSTVANMTVVGLPISHYSRFAMADGSTFRDTIGVTLLSAQRTMRSAASGPQVPRLSGTAAAATDDDIGKTIGGRSDTVRLEMNEALQRRAGERSIAGCYAELSPSRVTSSGSCVMSGNGGVIFRLYLNRPRSTPSAAIVTSAVTSVTFVG